MCITQILVYSIDSEQKQNDLYNIKKWKRVDNGGIDPPTYRMQSDRSTIWANYPSFSFLKYRIKGIYYDHFLFAITQSLTHFITRFLQIANYQLNRKYHWMLMWKS